MLLIETLVLLAAFTAGIWLTTLHGPLGGIYRRRKSYDGTKSEKL